MKTTRTRKRKRAAKVRYWVFDEALVPLYRRFGRSEFRYWSGSRKTWVVSCVRTARQMSEEGGKPISSAAARRLFPAAFRKDGAR
jgi:hypothetical protein